MSVEAVLDPLLLTYSAVNKNVQQKMYTYACLD